MQAAEMAAHAPADVALIWHLRSNHFPPVPLTMMGACKRAIKAANEGDWERSIRLPQGCSYRGKRSAPARAVIDAHHLEFFLDDEDDE